MTEFQASSLDSPEKITSVVSESHYHGRTWYLNTPIEVNSVGTSWTGEEQVFIPWISFYETHPRDANWIVFPDRPSLTHEEKLQRMAYTILAGL